MNEYRIELRSMVKDTCEYEYHVHDDFFAGIEATDIHKGDLRVKVAVRKLFDAFQLEIHSEGVVALVCDRCLDEMDWAVDTKDTFKVKLGENYSEEDETVTVPENEGFIDVAWYIYEFVALSLPLQHHHNDGLCNSDMMKVLKEHSPDGGEDNMIDPRWSDLEKTLNK